MVKPTATGAGPAHAPRAGRRGSSASSDHWKALLRRPPAQRLALDAAAFVDELNRRLRADPAARDDTRFVVAGGKDGRVAGSTWIGPDSMGPVVARIVREVMGEFEAAQPFMFDR